MTSKVKTFIHKDEEYEIRLVPRPDGGKSLTVFKNNNPALPIYYGIDKGVDMTQLENRFGGEASVMEYLCDGLEEHAKLLLDKLRL